MIKKIKCIKCKDTTIGHFDGTIFNARRQKDSFVLHGAGWNVMASCPRCGTMNNISATKNLEGKTDLETACPTEEIDFTKMIEEKNNNNTNEEVKNEQGNTEQKSSDTGGEASDQGSGSGSDGAGS